MEYILIGIIGTFIWIGYEMYNAPLYDEKTKTFIKKTKKSGSYRDLEKLGRGRSKH